MLIHGFGAFWEHYRDNIRGLAEKGNRVWGLTMVGFGRSEKPSIPYTELLLAELVRDFIIEVVKEPATLAGNSIGGEQSSSQVVKVIKSSKRNRGVFQLLLRIGLFWCICLLRKDLQPR